MRQVREGCEVGMIVITTMDALPDHCYECPCQDGESGYCQADKEGRYSDYRPYWCPLKEIHVKEQNTVRNSISKKQMDAWLKERQQTEWTNRVHEMGE